MKKMFLLTVSVFLFAGATVFAQDAVVVSAILSSSAQNKPYELFFAAFEKQCTAQGVQLTLNRHAIDKEDETTLLQKIGQEKPTVILLLGTGALNAYGKKALPAPTLFGMVVNITKENYPLLSGVLIDVAPETFAKETKRILPNVKTVGVIHSPSIQPFINTLAAAGHKNGLTYIGKPIPAVNDFGKALDTIMDTIDAYMMVLDPVVYNSETIRYTLLAALKKGIPVVGISSFYTKAGAMISFECNYSDIGTQLAKMTLRVTKGEKPAALPIQYPETVSYSLNMAVAKKLNISIPAAIVSQAAETFE